MSDFLWSRQALLAGASAIDVLVLVMSALVLFAGALAAWRAWTASPLPIRWWNPVPERLERADSAYGAAALKKVYPDALRNGVTSAGAIHIVLATLAIAWMARTPPPQPVDPGCTITIPRWEKPPMITVTQDGKPGGGRAPLVLPDPRNVIPSPIETHVTTLDPEDFRISDFMSPDGSIFGKGTGLDGEEKDGGPNGTEFGRNALADPDPNDAVPVDQLPELIWMAEPKYPEMARLAGLEGVVQLRLLVDTGGRVTKSRVDRSIAGLDEAALASGVTARFRPALWRGKPVKVWVALPIRFSLL
ncbi:MAG TPA: energy transducer TonB [Candidatus Eisenbacteria bacterium]